MALSLTISYILRVLLSGLLFLIAGKFSEQGHFEFVKVISTIWLAGSIPSLATLVFTNLYQHISKAKVNAIYIICGDMALVSITLWAVVITNMLSNRTTGVNGLVAFFLLPVFVILTFPSSAFLGLVDKIIYEKFMQKKR